jgi:dUTP pyrophosphatase
MDEVYYIGNAILNSPQHVGDAGRDLVAVGEPQIIGSKIGDIHYSRICFLEYETNIAIDPNGDHIYSLVYPRSSISANTNLMLGNCVGVIDSGYRNTIKLRFRYLPQPEDYDFIKKKLYFTINEDRIYHKGDRIGQLIFMNHVPVNLCKKDRVEKTSRGTGGFGSTGK